jgi:uncharacterized membrane protein YbhN (UPF0104 family)
MTRRTVALRLAVSIAVLGGCVWVARGLSMNEIRAAFAGASIAPMVLAVGLILAILFAKALTWRFLLPPETHVGITLLFRSTVVAYATSILLPLRAGEMVRLWMLRDAGVPLATGAAVALGEKLLDIIGMLVWMAPLPLLVPNLPGQTAHWISGLAIASLATLFALRPLLERLGDQGWRGELARGFQALHDLRRLGPTLGVVLVSWGLELALVMVVLAAVHVNIPLGAGLVVLLAINLAIALPSTPAQVGTLELGALAGLHLVGVGDAPAVAFAVTYHVLLIVPTVTAGLLVGARAMFRSGPYARRS